MKIRNFKLERYFARHEFSAPYLLCCSDCESYSVSEILSLEGEHAINGLQDLRLSYTESQGGSGLRSLISELYQTIGAEDILVTSGAEEAVFIFMNTALDRGDHVIVQYPCYQSLFEVARAAGCSVTRWEMREENGWEPDLYQLVKSIKKNTRAIVINSPHNPTGYLMPQKTLDYIAGLAGERGILLFSDEVYRFLEYGGSGQPGAACDRYSGAVSLGVMSKAFGLAGLRIGWMATRNKRLYKKMAAFKDYTSICNSAPSEFLAELALRHRGRIINRNMDIISSNLEALDRFFTKYSHLFSWVRPGAGPLAFPGIKWGQDVDDFCAGLVRSKGVLLLPGSCFHKGSINFRIGFGRKNMAQCLEKFEEYVSENL